MTPPGAREGGYAVRIQQILEKKGAAISVVPRDVTVIDIVKILADKRIGTLLVTEPDNSLAGIISERDVIKYIALNGADALELRAEEIMTQQVVTCTAESTVDRALTQMGAYSIRHLPVVHDGVPVGIVSSRDILDVQRKLVIEKIGQQQRTAELILMQQLD